MKSLMIVNMHESFELNRFLDLHENETNIVDYYFELLLDLSFENSKNRMLLNERGVEDENTYKTI